MEMESWKKLLHDSDTVRYSKQLEDYTIIIEARNTQEGWEIVKKYVGSDINFAETYNAKTTGELKHLLKHLKTEKELSKNEIRDITSFKQKNLNVKIKRAYKTPDVEKWYFGITENMNNYITVMYEKNVTLIDVVMEERLKYIEENILSKLHETLALDEETPREQHVYYYNKKSTFYEEPEQDDFDVEFIFE